MKNIDMSKSSKEKNDGAIDILLNNFLKNIDIYTYIEGILSKNETISDTIKILKYDNGSTKYEVPFVNSKVNGTTYVYYESGKLKSETFYVESKREGILKHYYESGELEYNGLYVNDKMEGIVKGYYKSGKLKSETFYTEGEEGISRGYYEDGELTI